MKLQPLMAPKAISTHLKGLTKNRVNTTSFLVYVSTYVCLDEVVEFKLCQCQFSLFATLYTYIFNCFLIQPKKLSISTHNVEP